MPDLSGVRPQSASTVPTRPVADPGRQVTRSVREEPDPCVPTAIPPHSPMRPGHPLSLILAPAANGTPGETPCGLRLGSRRSVRLLVPGVSP